MNETVNEIYIGYNGVGKTQKIEEKLKELKPKKEMNVIYIPTEQTFKDELLKEKTSGNGNFIFLVKNLIYEIYGKNNFTYEIDKKKYLMIKKEMLI